MYSVLHVVAMYCSLIRYVLENYGAKVLYGPFVIYTNKGVPPIEIVPGRMIVETRLYMCAHSPYVRIYLPTAVARMFLHSVEEANVAKTVLNKSTRVARILMLVEVLPPEDNDPDLLMKLASFYEDEARRFRELFKSSKLREILLSRTDAYTGKDTIRDILTRI